MVTRKTTKKTVNDNTRKEESGWAPSLGIVEDGDRKVFQVTGWIGGTGKSPTSGFYVGADGFVDDIKDAVDVQGPRGLPGTTGDQGPQGNQGPRGDKGDIGPAGQAATGQPGGISDDIRRLLVILATQCRYVAVMNRDDNLFVEGLIKKLSEENKEKA